MYIVLTVAEFEFYGGDRTKLKFHMNCDESTGRDPNPKRLIPQHTGLPDEVIDEFELVLPQDVATQFGIINRISGHIGNSTRWSNVDDLPIARAPARTFPQIGREFMLRVSPVSGIQTIVEPPEPINADADRDRDGERVRNPA